MNTSFFKAWFFSYNPTLYFQQNTNILIIRPVPIVFKNRLTYEKIMQSTSDHKKGGTYV